MPSSSVLVVVVDMYGRSATQLLPGVVAAVVVAIIRNCSGSCQGWYVRDRGGSEWLRVTDQVNQIKYFMGELTKSIDESSRDGGVR